MPEGFHERVKREALEESDAVLADLERLRFRADQVLNVLRALKLPVPAKLGALMFEPAPADTETIYEHKAVPVDPQMAEKQQRFYQDAIDAMRSRSPEALEVKDAPTVATQEPKAKPKRPGAPRPPEHLREMPAARKGQWRPTTGIPAAERQLKVYEFIREHPDQLAVEIADQLGLSPHSVGTDVKEMVALGLVRVTGTRRRKGAEQGKVGNKLQVADGFPTKPVPSPGADRDDTAAEPASGLNLDQGVLNLVRAAFRDREGRTVEPQTLARKLGLSVHKVVASCAALHEAGSLERHGSGGPGTTYVWRKPSDAGPGNPRRNGMSKDETTVSHPIAGTGRQTRSPSAEVNALLADCRKAGATVENASGHFIVRWQGNNGMVRAEVRSTPGGDAQQAVEFDRIKLRRRGLGV